MKRALYVMVLVGVLLVLAGCGGSGVSCPTGYTLKGATPNNPQGYCQNAVGDIVPVIVTGTPGTDLGRDWRDAKNPLQQAECTLLPQGGVCD